MEGRSIDDRQRFAEATKKRLSGRGGVGGNTAFDGWYAELRKRLPHGD